MLAKDIFAILTPGLALTFALGFVCVWRVNPRLIHIVKLAIAYVLVAICFFVPWLFQGETPIVGLLISGLAGMLAPIPFAQGLMIRLKAKPPTKILLAIAAVGAVIHCFTALAFTNIIPTFYNTTIIACIQLAVIANQLRAFKNRSQGDMFVPGVVAGTIFLLSTHLVAIGVFGIPQTTIHDYLDSNYWASINIIIIFLITAIAINLTILTMIDVTSALSKKASIDNLSGLYRRGEFIQKANRALAKAKENGSEVSLIVCDIDHFKKINDSFGHAAGDKVIAGVGRLLKKIIPENAHAGRIGGEEFAILLRNSNEITARLFAEQVRTTFENTNFGEELGNRQFTLSAGIASGRHHSLYREMFAEADLALYAAKDQGRNAVCLGKRQRPKANLKVVTTDTKIQKIAR